MANGQPAEVSFLTEAGTKPEHHLALEARRQRADAAQAERGKFVLNMTIEERRALAESFAKRR
ncbi:hypothetical protein HY213_01250 [Candidatus Peregrinibacteria bacterium]|nr:hypothetical protein [Candidatus Peregrinibacteria bacterium]